jgi:hypothetical protein
LSQLDTSAVQERGGRDENGIGPLAIDRFECSIDLLAGIGIVDLDSQRHGARRSLHFSQLSLGKGDVGRICENCSAGRLQMPVCPPAFVRLVP